MITRKFKTKIRSEVPIIDVEICNDISNPNGDWDYESSDIITFGILKGNNALIIQRTKKDNPTLFKKEMKSILKNEKILYSFNKNMEEGALKGFSKISKHISEIKIFKGRGWSKDKFFKELPKDTKIKDIINDPLKGNSNLVQERYQQEKYEDIIFHNLCCLIKEAYILKNKDNLFRKYADNIDENGWYIQEAY